MRCSPHFLVSGITAIAALAGCGTACSTVERADDDPVSIATSVERESAGSIADSSSVSESAGDGVPTTGPCIPRTEVLPTSTAYGPEDVANDIVFRRGLDDLVADSTTIVSGTLRAVVDRTAYRILRPPPLDANGTPYPFPTDGPSHLFWQPITVHEVFKGAEAVAPGSEVMLLYGDRSDCMGVDCEYGGEWLDDGEPGSRYVFFLKEAMSLADRLDVELLDAIPSGRAYSAVDGPYARLIVDADRVRYSDRERHRTEFTLDRRGCEFLEMLREEVVRQDST